MAICVYCGAEVKGVFCGQCGTQVSASEGAAAGAPLGASPAMTPEVFGVHKVVPFQASISNTGSSRDVAVGLQRVIDQETASDWEFVQIQELTTFVAGSAGCFGLGATPGTTTSMAVLIFRKK